jgi:hypothetical protein
MLHLIMGGERPGTTIMEVRIEIRKPKVGDRVAIPTHALVFFIKSVNEAKKTVDAEVASNVPRIEENIPWKILTFIDP